MAQEYTVKSAMKTGEYEGSYGTMFKYAVLFEGQEDAVELSQKPETEAPKEGDKLSGDIEDTKFGKRFKKEYKPGNGGGRGMSPEAIASLQRQAALQASATLYQGTGATAGQVVDTAKEFAEFVAGPKTETTASGDVLPTDEQVAATDINTDDIPF